MAATVALYARPEILRGEQCAGAAPIEGDRHAPIADRPCPRPSLPAAGRRGGTSIASAAPASRPGIATARTFTVLAHATGSTMINAGGIGRGGYVVEWWALRRGGTPAGRPSGQCTINFSQAVPGA